MYNEPGRPAFFFNAGRRVTIRIEKPQIRAARQPTPRRAGPPGASARQHARVMKD